MATMIEQALATARPAPTAGEVESLVAEKECLKEFGRSLLPVETIAKNEIAVRIKDLEQQVSYAKAAGDLAALSLLDQDVFSWAKEQKKDDGRRNRMLDVPVFAYVPLAERRFEAEVSWSGFVSYKFKLPTKIHIAYTDIFSRTKKYLDYDGGAADCTFSYAYPGVIPDHVRQVVKTEVEKKHFERLALVCEVDRWQTRWTPAPPPAYLDPILVGEREGALWVLASFDPTPLEEYLLNEFTGQ